MKKIALLAIIAFLLVPIFAQETNSQQDTIIKKITEDYEIPSYNLYQQDWGNEHIKIKSLGIVFGNNADIKVILVDNNTPFAAPLRELTVTSPYGNRKGKAHTGVDLSAQLGDSVFCCFDGVVRMAKEYGAYGNVVVVRHYNGLETVYAHLSEMKVAVNQIVSAGEVLGLAGHSGRATGDHLHFETRFLYEHFDPAKMIDFEEAELNSNVLTISKEELNFDVEGDSAAPSLPTTTSSPDVHVVKSGDTLYAIALKYHVTVEKLCQLNHITEDTLLQLGQKLRVK